MSKFRRLEDVVHWRSCLGCGACAYICPEGRIQLVDFFSEGIRPVVKDSLSCSDCRQCLDVCPAVQTDFARIPGAAPASSFCKEWGPVLEIWEGYATDPELRFKGSSGGALTAIGAYCLEMLGMSGVLHIAQDPDDPIRNRTRLSQTREELLFATGSRYSPASVCNGLGLVESAPASCAIIGKPSEIAAVRNAQKLNPGLNRNVGVMLSFFCAETPATRGTESLLRKMNVNPAAISDLRYRGNGWPGYFAPVKKGETEPCQRMTYRDSWAFLQAHRPWSVQLWPDGSGELADISCGDPWYEEPDGKNPGFSLVVVRTERGREIIEGAMAAGYLSLTRADNWKLEKSQSGLLAKKGAVWGRRLTMRIFGIPVTDLAGLDLFHCWMLLPFEQKMKSIVGTLKRVVARKLYRRLKLDMCNAKNVETPTKIPGAQEPLI